MSRGLSRTGLSRTGLSKTGMSKTGMSKTGMSRTEMSSTGLSRTEMSSTGLSSNRPNTSSILGALLELSDVFFNPPESFFVRRHLSLYSFCKSTDLLIEQLERVLFWHR